MKIRNGFVSNSSSSSFIIPISRLGFDKISFAAKNEKPNITLEDFDRKEKKQKKAIESILNKEIKHLSKINTGWDMLIYKGYFIATTELDNFDLISYLDEKYGIRNQNLTTFGSYTGFDHHIKTLKEMVDYFFDNEPYFEGMKNLDVEKALMGDRIIDVGIEFNSRLAYSSKIQGPYSGEGFREKYLSHLANKSIWRRPGKEITLDFKNVDVMSPTFAINAFRYFRFFATKEQILEKIEFINMKPVHKIILEDELNEPW